MIITSPMRQKIPVTAAHGDGIGPEWASNPARKSGKVEVVGIDLYMGSNGKTSKEFGDALSHISHEGIELHMLDNRGTIVWPGGMSETFVVDSFRCRCQPVESAAAKTVSHAQIAAIYRKITAAGYDIVKTETPRTFDGQQGFTLAQGQ
jgi:isocitrate dehydrogenase